MPYVYIVTNRPQGTLHVGVTNDLERRTSEHQTGAYEGFTKRYNLKQLVWFEEFDSISIAIEREKQLKHWNREWKVRLIESVKPAWEDLCES